MQTSALSFIFRSLRFLEIIIVFTCVILEIIQYEAFKEFHVEQGFHTSAYFNGKINVSTKFDDVYYYNGVKGYYYIVMILTLIDSGIYLTGSSGPFKRDISVNAFFMTLWITSGIANIYPAFEGHGFSCDGIYTGSIIRECSAGVTNISLGWINGILFTLTTLISLKLWKGRQERYEGERRVEALGEVVYKYKPRPNTMVKIDEPEQVMIYKTFSKNEMERRSQYYLRSFN